MRKYLFVLAAIFAIGLVACAPNNTPVTPVPNSLVVRSSGLVKDGTKVWVLNLSCGCAFPMAVVNADSTNIRYDFPDVKDTISIHSIRASKAKTLASGTYTGWLALVTVPPTIEVFRDTLRDTLIVP